MDYTDHSRFAYKTYDEIQSCINNGELNAYDIVYTKDTHENVVIAPDLSVIPIKSKVYRFLDVESAETFLNKRTDTYEGQIVSIFFQGKYCAYIVNRSRKGLFYVSPLSVFEGEVDYNTLGHKPIIQLEGEVGSPITLDLQNDGIYKITGQYKISDELDTIFSSVTSNLFLVQHKKEGTYVKKISADSITDYMVNQNGTVTTSVVPTTDWLKQQGYVTESYVDAKIATLDFITKEEIEDYVSNVVLQNIDNLVNERIETIFNERIQTATEKEALDIFVQIFK